MIWLTLWEWQKSHQYFYCVCAQLLSYARPCNPRDYSLPASSVYGISQQ